MSGHQGKKRKMSENESGCEKTSKNPLLARQHAFLQTLSKDEREHFFSNSIDPNRRADIWMQQADIGEALVNTFSWATPDDRAIRILRHFSPIVEIACGANAYWCSLMKDTGIDCIAFDSNPSQGGRITASQRGDFCKLEVRQGSAEVLSSDLCSGRNLLLCYPDEDDGADLAADEDPRSLGACCLDHFLGEYVVHIGEIYSDTVSLDQAPWGRSSSSEFQQQLAAEYHCLLKAQLTSWLHVRDTISVWKRTQGCSIVFASEEEEDEDEEVHYRYVPPEEQLPLDIASPSLAHLL